MLRKLRPRITYANVVATLALFVALGGTTYAAVTIGADDIKNDAVRSRHIKDGEVKSADVSPKLKASLKLHCASDLNSAGDICFESSLRPYARWQDAVKTCAGAQRRLPDAGELALVFDHLGAPQEYQWVATDFSDTTQTGKIYFMAPLIAEDTSRNIDIAFSSLGLDHKYRCVTSATN